MDSRNSIHGADRSPGGCNVEQITIWNHFAGLYAVISQAQRGGELIWTRHIIRVCSGASGLAWSDACVWDTAPASGADVIIPSGVHMVLDQQPPPMKTLQVRSRQVELQECKLCNDCKFGPSHSTFRP